MLEFLIDSIFDEFGGHIFQQIIGISIGTNCVSILTDLYYNEAECKRQNNY